MSLIKCRTHIDFGTYSNECLFEVGHLLKLHNLVNTFSLKETKFKRICIFKHYCLTFNTFTKVITLLVKLP